MSRRTLKALLRALLASGVITPAESSRLLARFEAGELDAGDQASLQATLAAVQEAARGLDVPVATETDARQVAMLAALLLLTAGVAYTAARGAALKAVGALGAALGTTGRRGSVDAALVRVALTLGGTPESLARGVPRPALRLGDLNAGLVGTPGARIGLSAGLQVNGAALGALVLPSSRTARRETAQAVLTAFQGRAYQLGAELAADTGQAGPWLLKSRVLVRDHHVAQAVLGTGRPLTYTERRRLDTRVRKDLRYLNRFAEDAASREARGLKPLTAKQAGARLARYGGEAYGGFFDGTEADGAETGPGYVVRYIALDDKGTCPHCSRAAAAGPYLPGEGPMPGRICDGGGFCRCYRVQVFDLAAYRRLKGLDSAAPVTTPPATAASSAAPARRAA